MSKPRPKWLALFALLPLMIGFLVVDDEMPIFPEERRFLEIGILLLVFGLMFLWMHSNRGAMIADDLPKFEWIDPDDSPGQDIPQAERLQPHFTFEVGGPDRSEREPVSIKGRYN